jgi:glutathione S-transferase
MEKPSYEDVCKPRNYGSLLQTDRCMPARYTLIIGTKNWSSWSLRAWLALRATGVEFREVIVRLRAPDTRARIRELVDSDMVPALRIEENGAAFTVFDSLAICETLAERHPHARLWPEASAARAEARSISAAMHSGFAALRATLPMEFARRVPAPALSEEVRQDIGEITRFWHSALSRIGGDGPFLFGAFTIADCMYAPVVSRFMTYDIAIDPVLQRYCDRVLEIPAMQDWLTSARNEVNQGIS